MASKSCSDCGLVRVPTVMLTCWNSRDKGPSPKGEEHGVRVCMSCVYSIPCNDRHREAEHAIASGDSHIFLFFDVDDGQPVFLTLATIARYLPRALKRFEESVQSAAVAAV